MPGYISVQLKLGALETKKLIEYLTVRQRARILTASYVTSVPASTESIAYFNIRISRIRSLEKTAQDIRNIVPKDTQMGVLPFSPI